MTVSFFFHLLLATAQLIFCQSTYSYQFWPKRLDAVTELFGCLVEVLMNKTLKLKTWTISGAFSLNHRHDTSCHLHKSRFNSGLGDATLLLFGNEEGAELVNWSHYTLVQE